MDLVVCVTESLNRGTAFSASRSTSRKVEWPVRPKYAGPPGQAPKRNKPPCKCCRARAWARKRRAGGQRESQTQPAPPGRRATPFSWHQLAGLVLLARPTTSLGFGTGNGARLVDRSGGGTHQQPIPSLRQSERHSSRPESPRTHQPHDSGVLFRTGHHQHLLLTLLDLATPCSPPLAADRDPRLLAPSPSLSLSLSLRPPPSATTRSAAVCAPRTRLLATLLSNTISSSPPPLARTPRPPPVAGSSAMIDRCAANVAAV